MENDTVFNDIDVPREQNNGGLGVVSIETFTCEHR